MRPRPIGDWAVRTSPPERRARVTYIMKCVTDVTENEIDTIQLRREEVAYEGLAAAVRELLDATVRTKIDAAEVDLLTEQVRDVSAKLLSDARPGAVGLLKCADGRLRDPANPVSGRRNAFALPLKVVRDKENKRASATFNLGAPYEGPPDHTHGGVLAMLLDQVMGMIPALVGRPGMTAYLNVTYRRPSPLLTDLGIEAWVDRTEGWKTYVGGRIFDSEGRTTAEAEALFIVPKFARERLSKKLEQHPMSDAGDYDGPQNIWFTPVDE